MYQEVTLDPETDPGYERVIIHNQGSGKATIFMEGKAITATWKKPSATAPQRAFYDSSGNEIPFVRGEIFMESIPTGTEVLVK